MVIAKLTAREPHVEVLQYRLHQKQQFERDEKWKRTLTRLPRRGKRDAHTIYYYTAI